MSGDMNEKLCQYILEHGILEYCLKAAILHNLKFPDELNI